MKRILIVIGILLIGVSAAVETQAQTERKTYQARCTDNNTSLYLLIYEKDGKLDGGFMYVENMQVATLTATNAGTGVIRAKVDGNTANVGFEIHKSGSIMVGNYTTGVNKRVKICTASYKYQ